jgi:hypothetical protein
MLEIKLIIYAEWSDKNIIKRNKSSPIKELFGKMKEIVE